MATLNRDKYHTDLKGSEQHLPLQKKLQNDADPEHAQDNGSVSEELQAAIKTSEGDSQIAEGLRKSLTSSE